MVNKGKGSAGWRTIAGKRCYFRSRWEYNYGLYLEFLKKRNQIVEWEHEPKTFEFEKIWRGQRTYKPDYRVTYNDNSIKYIEVKGYLDPKSKTKLKRMKIYHPKETVIVIDGKWFAKNGLTMRALIPEWEGGDRCRSSKARARRPLAKISVQKFRRISLGNKQSLSA